MILKASVSRSIQASRGCGMHGPVLKGAHDRFFCAAEPFGLPQAAGIFSDWPGMMWSGSFRMSRLALKITGYFFASP